MHTKLRAPLGSPFQVARQQISDRINLENASRLVLIHGPAGFGKTTAMLQLREIYQKSGLLTSWLTFDDADNEVQRFLSFLSRAIENILPLSSQAAMAEASGTGDVALTLVDTIAGIQKPFAFFLDDFETLNNPVVLGLISQIIDALPPNGRIFIGSRSTPPIALGRFRARGYLTEIDSSLLRFSAKETSDFISHRKGLSLTDDQIDRLNRKAEGWASAIYLAAISLERRSDVESFIDGFSGSNASIADYLADDVLGRLPAEMREFLLKSSILSELNESLCNAVCGCENSQSMLHQLERENLFLIPLDSERTWYRYHSLFAGFLRSELQRHLPDLICGLHYNAARWYLSRKRPIPAIDHAILSADISFAVDLLERNLNTLLGQGRLRLLGKWLDSLPDKVFASSPRLKIAQAWSVMLTRGARAALDLVKGIDEETLEAEARALLLALRPMLTALLDEIDESYEMGIDALPGVPPQFHFSHGMLAQALTQASIIKGRFADAHRFADQARKAQEPASGQFNLVLAESAEAIIDLMQGRLKQARVRLSMVADSVAPSQPRPRYGNTFSGILFSETLYESGECDEAQRLLEIYVPLVRELAQPDTLIISHTLLARMAARRGDRDRALHLLGELESTGHRLGLARAVASARLEHAHLALLRGDIRAAKDYLANAAEDAALWQKISRQWFIANDTLTLSLARVRWLIHAGEAAKALPILKKEIEDAELGQRHRRALKLRILMADAMHRTGQHKQAMRTLARTLEFAAPEGFVQTFLEEGPVVEALLQECTANLKMGTDDRSAASFQEWLSRFSPPSASRQPTGGAETLAEPLTPKETQVLECLAEGMSNNGIAAKLFVSETTVRTHLRNIFNKLLAENRVQAVAIARRLRLIA